MFDARPALCCFVLALPFATATSPALGEDPPSAVAPVLKLFQSGRVPPERMASIVEMICNRGNEHDLRVVFERVVKPDGFSPDLRRQVLAWLADAASTRKVKPTGDLSSLETLVADRDPRNQLAAIRLAAVWKLASSSKVMASLALSEKSTPDLQAAAIDGLVAIGDATGQQTIRQLASDGKPMRPRMRAIAALATLDLVGAAQQAADSLALAGVRDDPNVMLTAFFNRQDGSRILAEAVKKRPPSLDVAKMALRYMYSIGRSDPELSAVLSEAAGVAVDPPPPTQAEVAKLVVETIEKGDAARGEAIFRRSDLSCLRCHAINRAGGQVGPDLSAVGVSSPVDYLVNAILNPNLAVKEQYVTKLFALTSGQVLTGIVVDRDDNRVLLRDAQGKTITIPTADVDQEADGKSLMPQGLTKFLTHDEVVDLCRFISELGKPGAYAVSQASTIRLWRVMNNPPQELTQDVPHLEHIRELVLGSQPDDWTSAYCNVAGSLPLAELAQKRPQVVLLQGHIHVKQAGKLSFNVASTEPFQAWVDAEPLGSKAQFEVSLQPGRRAVTLRVEISERDSPQLKVDVAAPNGATTQFEIVVGA